MRVTTLSSRFAAGVRSTRVTAPIIPRAAFSATAQRRSQSDYGGGNEGPKGQRQSDMKNKPSGSEDLEHPGPKSPADSSNSSGSGKASSSSSSSGGKPGPAIHNEKRSLQDEHEDEDVKRHNDEAKNRHDRDPNGPDEKVEKGYWKQGQ